MDSMDGRKFIRVKRLSLKIDIGILQEWIVIAWEDWSLTRYNINEAYRFRMAGLIFSLNFNLQFTEYFKLYETAFLEI